MKELSRALVLAMCIIVAGAFMYAPDADAAAFSTVKQVKSVKAVSAGETAIKVSWSKYSCASGYMIYRATAKNGKYSLVKTVTNPKTTYWKNTKVKTEKTYYYKVKAYKKYRQNGRLKKKYSKYSSKVSGKALSSIRTITPTGYSTEFTGISDMTTLHWNKVSGADGYLIYMNSGNGYGLEETITSGSTTSCNFYADSSYVIKVRAYKKYNGVKVMSKYSAEISPVFWVPDDQDYNDDNSGEPIWDDDDDDDYDDE